MSYDPTTDAGRVRLLINDTNTSDEIFSDIEIGVFLDLRSNSVFRAAATALRTIAGNETLVQKVIRILDLQTDGASLGRELRLQADKLEETADKQDVAVDLADDEDATFEVAEMVLTVQQDRDRRRNDALREL